MILVNIQVRYTLFVAHYSQHSFRPHYGPGVDSASNRNEHQEYFLGVKAAVV
jgi:hypothetical protein